jgi:ribosomal protein L34
MNRLAPVIINHKSFTDCEITITISNRRGDINEKNVSASKIKRNRKHGFMARMRSRERAVIKRRRKKGVINSLYPTKRDFLIKRDQTLISGEKDIFS